MQRFDGCKIRGAMEVFDVVGDFSNFIVGLGVLKESKLFGSGMLEIFLNLG